MSEKWEQIDVEAIVHAASVLVREETAKEIFTELEGDGIVMDENGHGWYSSYAWDCIKSKYLAALRAGRKP